MKRNSSRLLEVGLFVLAIGLSGAAKAQTAAGRVISVRPAGSVKILRAGNPEIIAETGIILQPGDLFEFGPESVIRANIYGREETYDLNRHYRKIPPRDVGWFSPDDAGFLAGIERFLMQPRRSIPSFAQARGVTAATKKPLHYDPLIPGGRQFVPTNSNALALLWRDGATFLRVSESSGTETEIDSGTQSWALIPVGIGHLPVQIRTSDGALQWSIEPAVAIPSPPWFALETKNLSEAQRLTRAIWLLNEGPVEWHMFALGELADLAASGNFIAGQVWQGARSGEWEEFPHAR